MKFAFTTVCLAGLLIGGAHGALAQKAGGLRPVAAGAVRVDPQPAVRNGAAHRVPMGVKETRYCQRWKGCRAPRD